MKYEPDDLTKDVYDEGQVDLTNMRVLRGINKYYGLLEFSSEKYLVISKSCGT